MKAYELPDFVCNREKKHLVIYEYKRQDIRELLNECKPESLSIVGNHKHIDSIAEHCEIKRLDIRLNKVTHMNFLDGMSIESLTLNCSHIENIDPIIKIKGLKRLKLWKNSRLKDISALGMCIELEHLSLYGCHKVKYPPFDEIRKLKTLSLDCCSGLSKNEIDNLRNGVEVIERKVKYL